MNKYEKGMILVFIGESDDSHSKNFIKGNRYTILSKTDYDYYDPESEYTSGYNEVITFENSEYGCFTEFADGNFIILDDYRNEKIKDILE